MRTTTQIAKNFGIHFSLILLSFLAADAVLAQGSLTPPGPPKATMKTLEQIEPRIDLQNAPAGAVTTTDANYHYIITQPGSYYLSANLGVTKFHGIQISAEGVTLDLNGFEISRASGSGGNGIRIAASSHRASVRNGSVTGFSYGIHVGVGSNARGTALRDLSASNCTIAGILAGDGAVLESCRAQDNQDGIAAGINSSLSNCVASGNSGTYGIFASPGSSLINCTASGNGFRGIFAGRNSSLTNCTASSNGGDGIYAEGDSSLTNCTASGNSGTYGIYADSGSSLSNCTASDNRGTYGIYAASGVSLTNCTARANTSTSSFSAGIRAGDGCTVSHSTAYGNTSTAGTSTRQTGIGFALGSDGTIEGCTASNNKGDGIRVDARSSVRGNHLSDNATGTGANLRVFGARGRVDGNHIASSILKTGLRVEGNGNVITRNSVGGCDPNYDIAANNKIFVLAAPNHATAFTTNGGGGTPFGTDDPWANISY